MLGVLVWGGGNQLCLTINRADFWDHRGGEMVPGEHLFEELKELYDPDCATAMDGVFEAAAQDRPKGAFRNTRLPMGRYELILRSGVNLSSGELDLERGFLALEIAAEHGQKISLMLGVHPKHSALLVEDPGHVITEIVSRPAWEWVGTDMLSRGFHPPVLIRERSQFGWVQECPADPAMAALCERAGAALFLVMEPGRDGAEGRANAQNLLAILGQKGVQDFREKTERWWTNYWKDLPTVQLPDEFFSGFLDFALFKFAAATSPEGFLPCSLQGPWCEEYQMAPWAADYHFNVNIQQIYGLSFPTGKVEHLLPLFSMLDRCLDVFRENARRMVGIDDGILITHTTDDRGYACGGVGAGACIDHAVSGWTAQLYWLYYQHTGDRQFLRERALPFMRGVMRVFEEMLETEGGELRLPISISAEYGRPLPDGTRQRVGANASYQFACTHMLVGALIEAGNILDEKVDPAWLRIREFLPPWTLIGNAGSERIAIWENADLEISHRHHSHLACIYPFDSLRPRTFNEEQIVKRTLSRWLEVGMSDWSEWCLPWAAIIQAREGYTEGPYFLLKIFRDIFLNEGWASVYQPRFPGFTLHGLKRLNGPLESCEIMQLDGTMGFATAVYEMLVHMHGGIIRFFPAVPAVWRDLSFTDVRLPGSLRASGKITDGDVSWIKLKSLTGGWVCLDVSGYQSIALQRGSECTECELPLKLELEHGESIEGVPRRGHW